VICLSQEYVTVMVFEEIVLVLLQPVGAVMVLSASLPPVLGEDNHVAPPIHQA